ncbi:MAG: aminopeptidase P family N-terminal domain-containing protein [Pseudomonadota bacterium]
MDFERLRKARLHRAREQIEAHDFGALVLFAGANIRYVTGSYQGNWKYNINIRYAVLPHGGGTCAFRDSRFGHGLRQDGYAMDGREGPACHDVAVGGGGRPLHGWKDG